MTKHEKQWLIESMEAHAGEFIDACDKAASDGQNKMSPDTRKMWMDTLLMGYTAAVRHLKSINAIGIPPQGDQAIKIADSVSNEVD